MKKKVLVANRSEIACRIYQACKELGLVSVGVFVPGDEESRHVTYADELHEISSYLDIPSLLKVAEKAKVDLIHPGYGFLSERPAFVDAVEKAGFIFVGPTASTLRTMGGKISAKELAMRENIPTLPWAKISPGESLVSAAKKVGYPLILKAHAGGGGKGMRRVDRAQDLEARAESARAEALASFGESSLFIELFLSQPRHIEVQVFGDGRGGGVHFGERECSLQRKHQKIWEESPAPHLSQKIREKIYEASLKMVRAVQYRSAGTVEFLVGSRVDTDEDFYFLEMNTRLQVEHPVTEWVTGVDLVQTQLRQALDPYHPVLKESLITRGHAIEVRLNAEDPAREFMPTPGRIEKLKWPTGAGIRIESGIEEGQRVGTQFDSLLAKLIVHAESRESALNRLEYALSETVILGIGTNQNYLLNLCQNPAVKKGKVYTQFLEERFHPFVPQLSDKALSVIHAIQTQGMSGRPGCEMSQLQEQAQFISPWNEKEKGFFSL